jgi:Transposase DDE domain group 1
MATDCRTEFTFWKVGPQEIHVDFSGGQIVSDAGLLALRDFDKKLGFLSGLAERWPDPRAQAYVRHSKEALLVQQVYQILGGYADWNDAQPLRDDPLFRTLVGVSPDQQRGLASGSTLARFHHAYTRRDAERPAAERPVLLEQQRAQCQRIKIGNHYLVETFIRTRRRRPSVLILDLDASDDATHGKQVLSGYHGYFGQHQYFPLLVYEGISGFPLGAWLRPGTVHASCGAVGTLQELVAQLRQAFPGVCILVRGDTGFAVPEMYEFCEREDLWYVFGYASNAVLKARTAAWLEDLETYYAWYGYRDRHVQRFEAITDYQADSWSQPRRIVAKIEINPQGSNRRFLVTNLPGQPRSIYQRVYVQRGDIPESPIGELKNGLRGDRLSAHRFRANGMKLLEHMLAYALVVLYREAVAEAVPELAKAEVSTLRSLLWKVAARVVTSGRRIWFHFSETWPFGDLWRRAHEAARAFAEQLQPLGQTAPPAVEPPLLM